MKARTNGVALAALTGLTLLVGGIGAARAAETAPETEFFNHGNFATRVLTFNKFDPSLGTLTGAVFTLDSDTITFAAVRLDTLAEVSSGSATLETNDSFRIEITDFLLGVIFSQNGFASASCSAENSICQQFETAPNPFDGTFTVPGDGGALSDFIGLGSTFDVVRQIQTSRVITSCEGQNVFCLDREPGDTPSWIGSLTLHYTYEPVVAVPEPGALALLATGLAGLAFVRRRRVRGE